MGNVIGCMCRCCCPESALATDTENLLGMEVEDYNPINAITTAGSGHSSNPHAATYHKDFKSGEEWVQEELPRHTKCDESCRLRNFLERLDSAVYVDNLSGVHSQLLVDSNAFLDSVACALEDIDPIWSCKVERRGSTTNNLKTGCLNEIDFLLKLDKVGVAANEGWKLEYDKHDYHKKTNTCNYGSQVVGYESNCQIRLSGKFPSSGQQSHIRRFMWKEQYYNSQFQYDASEMKKQFTEALETACEKFRRTTSTGIDTASKLFSFLRGNLLYFPPEVSYAIKLDITPCISYRHNGEEKQWLVPSTKLNNWRLANDDPKELGNSIVRQAVRILKSLRDIDDAGTTDESPIVKNICCAMAMGAGSSNFVYSHYLSVYATQEFQARTFPGLRSKTPSYAILGTVVQCYRKKTGQNLCSLVLASIEHFQLVCPDGRPFCRFSLSSTENLDWSYRILHLVYQLTNKTKLAENLLNILPPCYSRSKSCLEQYSKDADTLVSTAPHHSSEVSRDVTWDVYRMDVQSLKCLLNKVSSLMEIYIHTKKSRKFWTGLHAELKELEKVLECQRRWKLYLGVLRLKEACLQTTLRAGCPTDKASLYGAHFERLCNEETIKADFESSLRELLTIEL